MLNSWLESSFQHLSSSIKQGRVPHSIIISGDNTLGGASLALEIAKLILCENRQGDKCCDNCKSCLLFNNLQQGSHPDFLSVLSATTEQVDNGADLSHNFKDLLSDMGTPLLEESVTPVKGNKSIKVESIRRLCEWIVEGSILGNGKVCVVSNAQLMNEASSNALLKTFEEPPKDSCIILLTSTFDALPATILSRALKIQLPNVEERVGIDYLSKELKDNFNQDRARVCLELAKSSPIGALQYYNEQLDLIATEILQGLNDAIENRVNEQKVVSSLNKLTDEQKALILRLFIKDLLKYKARVSKDQLPLLKQVNVDNLCKLSAVSLFKAYNLLTFVNVTDSKLPSRAPNCLLSAFIQALRAR